jgi:hypothetical protein
MLVSALPRNVAPGSRVPLAAFTIVLTTFWLFVIRWIPDEDGG